jgi:hypothetical protein
VSGTARLASWSNLPSNIAELSTPAWRRSPRRLGFELVGADARRLFYIRRKDSNETPDLLDFDLAGVEAWVREYVQAI